MCCLLQRGARLWSINHKGGCTDFPGWEKQAEIIINKKLPHRRDHQIQFARHNFSPPSARNLSSNIHLFYFINFREFSTPKRAPEKSIFYKLVINRQNIRRPLSKRQHSSTTTKHSKQRNPQRPQPTKRLQFNRINPRRKSGRNLFKWIPTRRKSFIENNFSLKIRWRNSDFKASNLLRSREFILPHSVSTPP